MKSLPLFVLQLPALRTLGNIVTGNDEQTQHVLDGGILPYLLNLMGHTRPGIVRVCCSTYSSPPPPPPLQFSTFSCASSFICVLVLSMQEAVWTVSNIIAGNRSQVQVRTPVVTVTKNGSC